MYDFTMRVCDGVSVCVGTRWNANCKAAKIVLKNFGLSVYEYTHRHLMDVGPSDFLFVVT